MKNEVTPEVPSLHIHSGLEGDGEGQELRDRQLEVPAQQQHMDVPSNIASTTVEDDENDVAAEIKTVHGENAAAVHMRIVQILQISYRSLSTPVD